MGNIASMPKTETIRFKINPEIKQKIENIYSQNGLTLTQAINIFIQQSINAGGFPFPITADNAELIKAHSTQILINELEAGKNSGELLDEREVYNRLGVEI
ncbi:MAG: type II toxin-antitoxin system RelB/DinJ family antitoxin [Clostridia bacterium]|nr:type II toxin-antitoxin system RelB/DinJ family antitoxin [Clostridia bacterium]MBQ2347168.1 type II toxin-antitoxin system RelB/DinJ family antitoxin [Clostridia bacterium]MBQ5562607.1 type II toxin-antitoxin system RelB/DinJ family antitoxin [Clostridia bacterium]